MSAESSTWSLLHVESKIQFDSLTYQQAQALVHSFSDSEYSKWAAWHEGLAEWQLLEDLLGVLHVQPKPKPAAPAPPTKPPPFTGAHASVANAVSNPAVAETVVTQTNSSPMIQPDGRLSKRFMKRYKVFVGTKGKMHESTTIDLSLTGLQIEDGIPAGNDGSLEVALVNSKGENLSLICAVIPDERRTRLKIVRAGKLDQLQQWLQNPAD